MYFIKLTKPKMLIIILSLKNLAEKMNKQLIKKFNTARVHMLTTMNTYFMGELANKGILAVFDLIFRKPISSFIFSTISANFRFPKLSKASVFLNSPLPAR